jgi:hypothetical protein
VCAGRAVVFTSAMVESSVGARVVGVTPDCEIPSQEEWGLTVRSASAKTHKRQRKTDRMDAGTTNGREIDVQHPPNTDPPYVI